MREIKPQSCNRVIKQDGVQCLDFVALRNNLELRGEELIIYIKTASLSLSTLFIVQGSEGFASCAARNNL